MIVAIVGPSGSGKTYLAEKLKDHFRDKIKIGLSDTTRSPREGEVDGVHYNFVSVAEFEQKRDDAQYVEHIEFHGNYYGFDKDEFVNHKHQPVVVVVEPDGLKEMVEHFGPEYIDCIYLDVPKNVRFGRMLKERGNKAAKERIEDGIQERFHHNFANQKIYFRLYMLDDNMRAYDIFCDKIASYSS